MKCSKTRYLTVNQVQLGKSGYNQVKLGKNEQEKLGKTAVGPDGGRCGVFCVPSCVCARVCVFV